jgi:putative endonuclease
MPYVYILRCCDGSLYCGWAIDLEARLAKHADGTASKYTRSRRPVMLMYSERHDSKLEAIRRERHIKQWSRAEKEALVGGDPAVPTRVSDPGRERMTRR